MERQTARDRDPRSLDFTQGLTTAVLVKSSTGASRGTAQVGACGRLVLEDTGWTSTHGAEGAVAVKASRAKLVARSATSWLEL